MGLGSEIRDPEKTYSGSRIQRSKRHRIPDPDPQHCFKDDNFIFGSQNTSVVDRHCFDADLDPDPNFQNNADAHVDPTPSFLMLENHKFIYLKKV